MHLQLSKELLLLLGWDEEQHHIFLQFGAEPLLQQRPQVLEMSRRANEGRVLYCSPVAVTHRQHRELHILAPASSKCVHFTGKRPWII